MLLVSCKSTPPVDTYTQYDQIIQQDLNNKQKELDILRELRTAQLNNDQEAREFFMQEYMKVPRLELTVEQKKHPLYKEWIDSAIISTSALMDTDLDYIK